MSDICTNDRLFSAELAMRSIYINFEGEYEKTSDKFFMPYMLGAYTPKLPVENETYRVFLFRDNWQPLTDGAVHKVKLSSLKSALDLLIAEAESRGGYLLSFGSNVLRIVQCHCPELLNAFSQLFIDLKPAIDNLYHSRYPLDTLARPDSLKGYADFYLPGQQMSRLYHGSACTCRRIDYAAQNPDLTGQCDIFNEQLVSDLFVYNRSNCEFTWKLIKKLANYRTVLHLMMSAA